MRSSPVTLVSTRHPAETPPARSPSSIRPPRRSARARRGRGASRVPQQLSRLGVGMHRRAARRDGGGARARGQKPGGSGLRKERPVRQAARVDGCMGRLCLVIFGRGHRSSTAGCGAGSTATRPNAGYPIRMASLAAHTICIGNPTASSGGCSGRDFSASARAVSAATIASAMSSRATSLRR